MITAPAYDVDFYSDEFIADPYPHYAAMRALGPVVYLPRHGNYAAVRFNALREAMHNATVFRSGLGVAADDTGCGFLRGNTLASDPPLHDEMRKAMGAPLLPAALEQHRPRIDEAAHALVAELCERRSFDGMQDVARHLPLTVVTELVGLPEDGRENMLLWAASSFDILGVQNERGRQGIERIKDMRAWIATRATAERLRPGSWTARILELSAAGDIPEEMAPQLIRDYINPSLDTTISATGELLLQLAHSQEQWDLIRSDPSLILRAVDEAVRLSTPIRSFSRTLASDYRLADVDLPAGTRIMMVFASANRDPDHFPDPDKFDVRRKQRDHVGFGHGIHMCVGMHLARLEMGALLKAMIPKIARFHAEEPTVAINNTIRSYARLPLAIDISSEPLPVAQTMSAAPSSAMAKESWIPVQISRRTDLAQTIIGLSLVPAEQNALPAYEAGAHIDLEIAPGLIRQYSLYADPASGGAYEIAVHREAQSRGGSVAVHEQLKPGMTVRISPPRNHFALDEGATDPILIAGGIGITPILAMAWQLHRQGAAFKLVYRARDRAHAAFVELLRAAPFADSIRIAFDDEGGIEAGLPELRGCPFGRTIYCCGPQGLVDYVRQTALQHGWQPEQIRVELFQGQPITSGAPFTVKALRSKVSVAVPADGTILDALAEAGIEVPSSCRSGVCGTCLVDVLAGEPDHRDLVQTDAEKASNQKIALCCSRARTAELVIDL